MELEKMTKEEKSLLLYLENRCFEFAGAVHGKQLTNPDRDIIKKWETEGFIKFGGMAQECLEDDRTSKRGNYWCMLSEDAWKMAHSLRMARSKAGWSNRQWVAGIEKTNAQRMNF